MEFERWSLEIRRGALSLAILSIVLGGESHGYEVIKKLSNVEYAALRVEPGTVYPLLRRLEKRGILEGRWSESSTGRMRRLYFITKDGRLVLRRMVESWQILNNQIMMLVEEAGSM